MFRPFCALLALTVCAFVAHSAAPVDSAALVPFLGPPSYRVPKLAPDGKLYAIVITSEAADTLVTVDLGNGKATPIMKATDGRVVDYWWKGNDKLLLLVQRPKGETEFHTFALDGKETDQAAALRRWVAFLANPLQDDPDHVLILVPDPSLLDQLDQGARLFFRDFRLQLDLSLQKLNVRTGKAEWLPGDSAGVGNWITTDDGQPRASFGRVHERWFMSLAQGPGQPWRRVELGEKRSPDFLPIAIHPDQRRLVGLDATADTVRLVAWDPRSDARANLCSAPDADIRAMWRRADDWNRMRAYLTAPDSNRLFYVDPDIQQIAADIDRALPHTVNQLVSASRDRSRLIVTSSSERVPETYYLFDRTTKRLSKLGASYPKIDPARLGESRAFVCPARDGLMLHGRILLPPGGDGPQPAVVVVDDLAEPDRARFDPHSQLLASRGFAVVTIDHRGTTGYGEKFSAAGDLEIGGRKADDVVDALQWLAEQKVIDPHRVALESRGTGGLIAFQAIARYPDRFAAFVNLWGEAAPDELKFSSLLGGNYSAAEIKTRFGGESEQLKYLRSLDPLVALPKITVPVLHYYPRYTRDNSCFSHGERLEKQVAKSRGQHRWIDGRSYHTHEEFSSRWDADARQEAQRLATELLAFLSQNLAAR